MKVGEIVICISQTSRNGYKNGDPMIYSNNQYIVSSDRFISLIEHRKRKLEKIQNKKTLDNL